MGSDPDDYSDEFYGSRLLRFRQLTPHECNVLLKAAWPRTKDRRRRMYVGHGGGYYSAMARSQTRAFLLAATDRFMCKLAARFGSLEAAVRAGAARGLRTALRRALIDQLRHVKGRRADGPREDDWDDWDENAWRGDLVWNDLIQETTGRDRTILTLYREGVPLRQIGARVGLAESTVRRRLKGWEDCGLPWRPPWQRRR